MNWFPFVSRARLEDREETIRLLRSQLADAQEALDSVNYRLTGTHLYSRYKQPEPVVIQEAPKPSGLAQAKESLDEMLAAAGRNPRAVCRAIERDLHSGLPEEAAAIAGRMGQQHVEDQILKAIELGEKRAVPSSN